MENKNLKGKINEFHEYYTDAYRIAVKNGFEGTEAEWLEYLRADAVPAEQAAERARKEADRATNAADRAEQTATETANKAAQAATKTAEEAAQTATNAASEAATAATEAAEAEVTQLVGELGIVQDTGDSVTAVMSQKATTEYVKDYIPKVGTRNLLNVHFENANLIFNNGVFNKLTTGVRHAAEPEYIEVIGGETYTFSYVPIATPNVTLYAFEYTADKTFINFRSLGQTNVSPKTLTISNNCSYVRVGLIADDTTTPWEATIPDKFQMELGTEATEYIPPILIDSKILNTEELYEEMDALDILPYKEKLTVDAWEMGFVNQIGNDVEGIEWIRTRGYTQLRAGDVVSSISHYVRVAEYDPVTLNIIRHSAEENGWVTSCVVQNDCFARLMAYKDGDTIEAVASSILIQRNKNKYVHSGALPYDELHGLVKHYVASITDFDYAAFGLPTIEFNGDISSMTKDNAVTLSYKYGDREGTCTLKWQGSSSLTFPKKNYTVKFDTAFEAKGADPVFGTSGWGEQKKYCLKADWVDFSHCRNIVTARMWRQLLTRRYDNFEHLAKLKGLPNGGAIDGFPCFVVINGEWQGIYNFNIPKDGWMLGMGEGTKEAIVCADWTGAKCAFKTTAKVNPNGDDFEVEYVTDEDNADWVQAGINTLIQACIDCDGTNLSTIEQYIDINSAIDYYILVTAMGGGDNIKKNYLLSTYDGTKWFFTPYDMDGTWGLGAMGDAFVTVGTRGDVTRLPSNTMESEKYFKTVANTHRLFEIIYKYMPRQLISRYKYLREEKLTVGLLEYIVETHIKNVPMIAFEEEAKKWKTIPSTQVNNVNQIINWARAKLEILDYEIELLESSLASTNEA